VENLELSPEQTALLRRAGSEGVVVRDADGRAFRLEPVAEANGAIAPERTGAELHPAVPPVPFYMDQLPTPADVDRRAWARSKGLMFVNKRLYRELIDTYKLGHYLGGRFVATIRDDRGLRVVAIDTGNDDEFQALLRALPKEDYRRVQRRGVPPSVGDVNESEITGFVSS
jgi:hypothetical protein